MERGRVIEGTTDMLFWSRGLWLFGKGYLSVGAYLMS